MDYVITAYSRRLDSNKGQIVDFNFADKDSLS